MYVAVKGGERAIDNAHAWLAEERRGDPAVPELSVAQIREQMSLAVNRVMAEGSLYDPDLAALAIKQARGDLIEAIFLIRAYRTTLPRFGASEPVETAEMDCDRRISATFKDAPGGQVLGPTFDYTHRLLDFKLMAEGEVPAAPEAAPQDGPTPHITGFLNREGLIQTEAESDATPPDLTREPMELPAERPLRLQALTRGDEGFVLGMAYSTQRGYARNHAFVGELRIGAVAVEMEIPELGFTIEIGEITLTECETVNQFKGSKTEPPQFTRGYGLVFGQTERKAISMALVDRALRWKELGEDDMGAPAQDEEFVLMHCDNIQATGFLEHIKLPHYVDFQSELELVRKLRREAGAAAMPGGGGVINVVFDIGNVLIAWDPHAAFRHALDDEDEIAAVLDEIGFYDWNLEQDRGRSRQDAVAAIAANWPHRAELADGFFDRFHLTIEDKIAGTWAVMERLRARGHRIFGLTNFGPETWPVALRLHPQLGDAFEDVVVSGHEGLIKPDRAIYDLLCRRNLLSPSDCLFIDDSAANVEGARAAGWQAHHFTSPDALRRDLTDRGLL